MDHEDDYKRRWSKILQCVFAFAILIGYIIPTFTDPKITFGPCFRYAKDKNTPELQEIFIQKHSYGCQPSYQQLVMQQRTSGPLFEKESAMEAGCPANRHTKMNFPTKITAFHKLPGQFDKAQSQRIKNTRK